MLNARTARQWLWDAMGKTVISVLCSTALLGVPSEAILYACSLCGEAHAAVTQHINKMIPACTVSMHTRSANIAAPLTQALHSLAHCAYNAQDDSVVATHMAACASSSAMDEVLKFGIPETRMFEFWDWVGGRYSVCSSVGALPLSLKYGFGMFERFLAGARAVDIHYQFAPLERNLPVLMGLLGVWNMSFMGYRTRTILPYAEALLKLPAHIQQLAMESNGKRVTVDGEELDYDIGQIDFGEPGTNGQHSFFQLLHMGQVRWANTAYAASRLITAVLAVMTLVCRSLHMRLVLCKPQLWTTAAAITATATTQRSSTTVAAVLTLARLHCCCITTAVVE
eukprot:13796-Heterococcus_DN1.PRE.1